jgi:hypothetical protein
MSIKKKDKGLKVEVCFRMEKGIRDALEDLARSEYRTLDQQLEKIIMDYCLANNIVPVVEEEPKKEKKEDRSEEKGEREEENGGLIDSAESLKGVVEETVF